MSARAIVLAAGKGTRMKSSRPKVLHELCGRSMLWWSLEALRAAGLTDITVVTNPELQAVLADGGGAGAQTVVQKEQTGTGDAVRVALDAMPAAEGTVLVTYADMPLLDEELLRVVLDALAARSDTALALVTARMPLPSSFGRIVRDRKGKRVAGAGVDLELAPIGSEADRGVEGVLPQLRDRDAGALDLQLAEHVRQQVMGHRTRG